MKLKHEMRKRRRPKPLPVLPPLQTAIYQRVDRSHEQLSRTE